MARSCLVLVLVLLLALAPAARAAVATPADSIAYVSVVDTGDLIGVTLTNYGVIGNNFASRAPSLEYPLGTGYEHMGHGGWWIGAQSVDDGGAFIGVTTGMLDASQGLATPSLSEFTPAGNAIARRSSLPTSPYFDPQAVSQLDVISSFSDLPARQATGNPEPNRSLPVLVRQEAYAWSLPDYDDIVFLHLIVKTLGPKLSNVWIGLYTELASGPKNAYSSWPPSAASSPLGSWYSKKLLAWDGSLRLLREHRCQGYPIPSGCAFAVTPAWAGVQLLTPPDAGLGQHVTVAAWSWNPGDPTRDQDVERYAIMSAGTIQDLTTPDLMPVTGDPVELLAIGPFATLPLGDSVVVDFALVGGAEEADIQANARAAIAVYGGGNPTPVMASLAELDARPDRVLLTWLSRSLPIGQAVDVERRDAAGAWRLVGTASADGNGLLRFEDRDVIAGSRYDYRLVLRAGADGTRTVFGEVSVEVPLDLAFGLDGARGNPALDGRLRIGFALAGGAPARLEAYDPAGRRVAARDVASLGAGRHVVLLGEGAALPAGVYLVRLVEGGRVAMARAIVMR